VIQQSDQHYQNEIIRQLSEPGALTPPHIFWTCFEDANQLRSQYPVRAHSLPAYTEASVTERQQAAFQVAAQCTIVR
jgi:hypothetical protein